LPLFAYAPDRRFVLIWDLAFAESTFSQVISSLATCKVRQYYSEDDVVSHTRFAAQCALVTARSSLKCRHVKA